MNMQTQTSENPVAYQLHEAVLTLQNQLLSAHPAMPTLLQTIHRQLKADPTLCTILSEEEVGTIVSGLKRQTMTAIATSTAKSKSKSIKSIGVSDL